MRPCLALPERTGAYRLGLQKETVGTVERSRRVPIEVGTMFFRQIKRAIESVEYHPSVAHDGIEALCAHTGGTAHGLERHSERMEGDGAPVRTFDGSGQGCRARGQIELSTQKR